MGRQSRSASNETNSSTPSVSGSAPTAEEADHELENARLVEETREAAELPLHRGERSVRDSDGNLLEHVQLPRKGERPLHVLGAPAFELDAEKDVLPAELAEVGLDQLGALRAVGLVLEVALLGEVDADAALERGQFVEAQVGDVHVFPREALQVCVVENDQAPVLRHLRVCFEELDPAPHAALEVPQRVLEALEGASAVRRDDEALAPEKTPLEAVAAFPVQEPREKKEHCLQAQE